MTTSSPDAALDLARNTLREALLRWNPVMNLVSRQDTAHQIDRLLHQCQAGFHLLHPVLAELGYPVARLGYLDVGSGNGLPGLLWAAGFRGLGGSGPYWLVEPRQRRAWFLERVSREPAFPEVAVVAGRWGDLLPVSSLPVDVLVSLKALRLTEPEVLAGLAEGFAAATEGALGPQRVVVTRFLGPEPGTDAVLVHDLQAGGDGGGAAWQQTERRVLASPVVRLLVTAYARI